MEVERFEFITLKLLGHTLCQLRYVQNERGKEFSTFSKRKGMINDVISKYRHDHFSSNNCKIHFLFFKFDVLVSINWCLLIDAKTSNFKDQKCSFWNFKYLVSEVSKIIFLVHEIWCWCIFCPWSFKKSNSSSWNLVLVLLFGH